MISIENIEQIEANIKIKKANAKVNPPLLEKMCYALHLAELLKAEGLDFIFKGGTSLILLLDFPERFSIDIDIITEAKQEEIEAILERITQKSVFQSFSLDTKRSYQEGVPKAHYKLLFEGKKTSKGDNQILLDILFEKNPYPHIQNISAQKLGWLTHSDPKVELRLPSIESITGDKLTAFAPNTTGIPHNEGKSTEIIKQMFDLGNLLEKVQDLQELEQAYKTIVHKEIEYRALINVSYQDVLKDTFQTCVEVVKESNIDLKRAIQHFKNWTVLGFTRDDAFESSGKIAYLVAKMLKDDKSPFLKFDTETMQNKDFLIEDTSFNFLNKKLKKLKSGALFYWYQAVKLYI
jgi:predicted nucleotidyltransferase component of viral defense system